MNRLTNQVLALAIAGVLAACGGGDKTQEKVSTDGNSSADGVRTDVVVKLDQIYSGNPTALGAAKVIAAQAQRYLNGTVMAESDARAVLMAEMHSMKCLRQKISQADLDAIKIATWAVVFDTPVRRQRLIDVRSEAGFFEIEMSASGVVSC